VVRDGNRWFYYRSVSQTIANAYQRIATNKFNL